MRLRFTGLFLLALLVSAHVSGQKNAYEKLIPKIRYLSYFDSVNLFLEGDKAIRLAESLGYPEYEAEIYIFYGNHFYYKSNSAKAKKYYEKALKTAKKYKSNTFQNLSKIRLIYLRWDEGDQDNAIKDFKLILADAIKNKEYKNQIECYNALALCYSYQNKFKECMNFYMKGLKVAEENDDSHYTPVLLNNIGLLKFNNRQYKDALADFERALKIAESNNDARLTFHLLNNMALVYIEDGKKEEARVQYEKILNYAHLSNNPKELGIAAVNLSNLFLRDSNYNEALSYNDTAIEAFTNNKYTFELTKAYLSRAQILIKINKLSEALNFTERAKLIADSTSNLEDAVGIHITLSAIYEKQGNAKMALHEYKLYKKINDSLNDLMNTKAITEIQAKYNDEKKDAAIEKARNKNLELENKNLTLEQKNIEERERAERRMILGTIGFVSVLLMIVIYFYVSYNRKTRKQQQFFAQQLIHDIEEERNRIAKDLHDDVGQSLSAIKSRLNLVHQKGLDPDHMVFIETEVGKVIEQTRDISRKLYPAYLEKIGLTRSVARLMEGIQQSTQIVCSFEIDPDTDKLPVNMLTHIYRIIQECVNNTIKHADASALKVTIFKTEDKFQMIYQDNGKGIHKTEIKNSGVGLMSLKERTRILKGELNIGDNAGKGFKLTINFNQTFA